MNWVNNRLQSKVCVTLHEPSCVMVASYCLEHYRYVRRRTRRACSPRMWSRDGLSPTAECQIPGPKGRSRSLFPGRRCASRWVPRVFLQGSGGNNLLGTSSSAVRVKYGGWNEFYLLHGNRNMPYHPNRNVFMLFCPAHAKFPPRRSHPNLTDAKASMHVQLAPCRCKALTWSGRRCSAGECSGEVSPYHVQCVVDMKVVELGAPCTEFIWYKTCSGIYLIIDLQKREFFLGISFDFKSRLGKIATEIFKIAV